MTSPKKDAELDLKAFVPQLSEHNITEGDMQVAVRVLNAVASLNPKSKNKRKKKDEQKDGNKKNATSNSNDGLEAYKQPNLRPLRKALASCLELHRMTMFQGKEEEDHYEERKQERSLKRQKVAEQAAHKKYIASTALRKGRVERLVKLQEDAREEEQSKVMAQTMIPDGHVDTAIPTALLENNDNAGDSSSSSTKEQQQLPKLRSCYVCKVRFRELHHFYDQLCPSCAALNWEKRHQTADCRGMVAVVTGSRVKIGLQACLKLLRNGATVVATTRFPNAAVQAYRQEADFEQWNDRLQVYGLDLRDVTGLEAFTRFLKMRFPSGIDVLINNACQTVRRPVGYYAPLVEKEQTLWEQSDETHKSVLGGCVEFERVRRKLDLDLKQQHGATVPQLDGPAAPQVKAIMPVDSVASSTNQEGSSSKPPSSAVVAASSRDDDNEDIKAPFETSGLSHSAAMSQMILLPEDAGVSDTVLPPGITDINGQQLDLRTTNSWLLKMEEVSTPEIMECMFVNAIAPFVLNSRLKPLMCIPQDDDESSSNRRRPDRYIINVSAMEGKFYRYKMPNHPHTNMAKAALNMLTRTSAEDLAKKHRIFMNSVDTGWINDENPLERAKKTAENNNFQTPIDEVDAAARIVDPIFTGVNGGKEKAKDYGKFLKDYRESEW